MENATVAFQNLYFSQQLVSPYFCVKDSKHVFYKVKDLLLLNFILLNCAKHMQERHMWQSCQEQRFNSYRLNSEFYITD